jgi:anthranilate 1,2-dioxygenase ferredoxin subunit
MTEATIVESGWVDIGAPDAFAANEGCRRVVNGMVLAIFHVGGRFFALDDLCTHGRASLSEGFVEDGCVECPLHQALFSLETGAAMTGPATKGVRTYPIRIRDGRVEIRIDSAALRG